MRSEVTPPVDTWRYFLNRLETLLVKEESVRVAIDGNSAAGKTTLSAWLADRYDGRVIHMDDFFLQPHQRTPERLAEPGGNVDRERFIEEVAAGFKRGEAFSYRPFDCVTMTMGEAIPVPGKRLTIVEGAYCLHPGLVGLWDFKVFVELDPQTQSQRILMRNGPEKHVLFMERWIPMENRYIEFHGIRDVCDIVLDGAALTLLR